ncbi:metal-dependent hydrolase [Clostridium hydrogenum]|uniref:metal-dependent hydrolase n=1 Tax=Clostridium hydrogenum TaxID=2855764 RepID=UPI001F35E5FA|nr:metal-dependent hydrolase [Clostridium hydrogenum]
MTGKTHMSIGLAASATVLSVNKASPEIIVTGLALGLIGALAPDIDIKTSKISDFSSKVIINTVLISLIAIFIFYKAGIPINNIKINYKPSDKITYGLVVLSTSILFSKLTKHRSFSHSLLGLILFSLGVRFVIGNMFIYFSLGFISHMFSDMLTNNGIQLIYPIKKKFSLKFVHTGSFLDNLIGMLALALCLYITVKRF